MGHDHLDARSEFGVYIGYYAGTGQADITPTDAMFASGNIWLWGYGSRTEACTEIAEPLWARAVALASHDGPTVVILTLDAGALDPAVAATIKNRIAAAHPAITAEYVCINVSHTHGAPVPMTLPWQLGVGRADPDYLAYLTDGAVNAALAALSGMGRANVAWGRGTAQLGYDRHFPAGPTAVYDPGVDVLRVDGDTGERIATVFQAACHPVCSGQSNKVYSDFPGAARTRIEAAYGGIALFLQGHAGTVDPNDGADDQQTGGLLADAVAAVLAAPMHMLSGPIDAWMISIDLPFADLPDTLVPFLETATLRSWANWAGDHVNDPGSDGDCARLIERWSGFLLGAGSVPVSLPTPVQVLRVGTGAGAWLLAASGHEVVADFTARVHAIRPDARITTLGYSNSQFSYLPSARVLQNTDVRSVFPSYTTSPSTADNYEGGWSFLWYGHPAPLLDAVDDLLMGAHTRLIDAAIGPELVLRTPWARPSA